MARKNAPVSIHVAVSRLIALVLLFTSTVPASASSAPHIGDNPPGYPVFDITPSTVTPGKEYTIVVLSRDSTKPIPEGTQLVPPGAITVSGVTRSTNNSLSGKMTVPQDSPLGSYRFLLKDKDANVIGIADIFLTIVQGPIPPGIEPQVDVMWGVMPSTIVRHNFGRQIANNYYGIQIRIGNDSGYDLQIAGIGFKIPGSGLKNTVPTNSYRATRGTLEREQDVGLRAVVVNIVKGVGVLYSGFLPFWHMPNRKANANLAGAILTGPFEAGLELVVPDLTAHQLTRLDDQTLRDGLVVKNNTQAVTLAWVPRKLLNLAPDAGKHDDVYLAAIGKTAATIPNADRNWQDDPQYVNWKLGELVLVGQQITYINRVQVISTTTGGPVAPPPTVNGINPPTVDQGSTDMDLTIPGAYLDNATPILNDPATNQPVAGVKFSAVSADASGHILKTKITVAATVPPKKYRLIVTTAGGSFEKTLEIIQARPSIDKDGLSYDAGSAPKESDLKDADKEIGVTIKGTNFDNAQLVLPAGWKTDGPLAPLSATTIKAHITVPKGTKKNSYDIKIKNNNPNPSDAVSFQVQ